MIVPSTYYIVVCPAYPALCATFPDGFPFSSAIADPVVSDDGQKAATMAAVREDVDLEDYAGLPLVFYDWTASALALAKADHPTIPWAALPRFAGQPAV
jgi:hypothetical protein